MIYLGSKRRIANEILPIILKDRKEGQWYVEPFCGGCNTIDKVVGNRIANDIHYYLIRMFEEFVNGEFILPSELSEELYKDIKNNKEKYPPELVGFVGFGCSFASLYFGGFKKSKNNKNEERNHCLESKNNLLKQKDGLKGIIFKNQNYDELEIPKNSIIYCDPPYFNTTKYKSVNDFNTKKFLKWCIEKTKEGHKVYVSEYDIDKYYKSYFKSIWEKRINVDFNSQRKQKEDRIEKLFLCEV